MAPIHPIPSGTRDVLPDEMRELRALTDTLRGVFEEHGYGEVWTPAIEYETPAGRMGGTAAAYRVFDDQGGLLSLRTDLTVPIARVVASRYANAEPPLRLCSFAHVYRGVTPHRGQMRELLQAGCELIGSGAPDGTVELLTVLVRALEAVGLREFRIGVGDAALYGQLLDAAGAPAEVRAELLGALVARDLVALERVCDAHGLPRGLAQLPGVRGGPEVLPEQAERLRGLDAELPDDVRARVIYDLGLIRDLDYYTGAVFEVYAEGSGAPLGGGGRYDDLLAKFGRDLPAVGFALGVDRVHEAVARR